MKSPADRYWDRAFANPGETVDIGDDVFCDGCGREYTCSTVVGGVGIGGSAYCPECTALGHTQDRLSRVDETYVTHPLAGETFVSLVKRMRGGERGLIRVDIKGGTKE